MSEDKRKRGLGRGLSALLGETPLDVAAPADARGTVQVPVTHMESGRYQPRMEFDQEALQDLADSIRAKGILQPILVRPMPDNPERYEIIAGERRWRAAQLAQVHSVPVLVRDFSDREAAEVALIENLQRRDLSPLEEAEGYRRLMNDFARSQEDLASALGKSRSHVANMIRLLSLPEPVKGYLRDGRLTAGHARALLNAEDPDYLAQQVVNKGLNVRQTEKLAADKGGVKTRKPKQVKEKDSDTLALERDLARVLGLRVEVEFEGRGGHLLIHYDTLDQLDDILYRLNNPSERHRARAAAAAAAAEDAGEDADDVGSPNLDDDLDAENSTFAASFGRMPVSNDPAPGQAMDSLEESVDSWAAELAGETKAEQDELLENPYADEDGEFELDPEDEDEDDDSAPLLDDEAAALLGASADAEDETLTSETEVELNALLETSEDDGDEQEEDAVVEGDAAEALLDASADAWGDVLTSETESELQALLAPSDEDETEASADDDAVEALLDASADAWGDVLTSESESELQALLAPLDEDEDEDEDSTVVRGTILTPEDAEAELKQLRETPNNDSDQEDEDSAEALLDASADVWGEVLNDETSAERDALIASDDDETDDDDLLDSDKETA
jgi:ParB family chromosome partitioning protein